MRMRCSISSSSRSRRYKSEEGYIHELNENRRRLQKYTQLQKSKQLNENHFRNEGVSHFKVKPSNTYQLVVLEEFQIPPFPIDPAWSPTAGIAGYQRKLMFFLIQRNIEKDFTI